jgi:hypothetical protein
MRLQSDCSIIAIQLQGDCNAMAMQNDSNTIARRLLDDYNATAERMQSDCNAIHVILSPLNHPSFSLLFTDFSSFRPSNHLALYKFSFTLIRHPSKFIPSSHLCPNRDNVIADCITPDASISFSNCGVFWTIASGTSSFVEEVMMRLRVFRRPLFVLLSSLFSLPSSLFPLPSSLSFSLPSSLFPLLSPSRRASKR